MRYLVFVVAEVLPHLLDEYSQTLADLFQSLSDVDRSRAIVLIISANKAGTPVSTKFSGVRSIEVDTRNNESALAAALQHPPEKAYTNTPLHWQSACVYRALNALAESCTIAYVEFPDVGGLGFCTLQERRLHGFLDEALITVRLGTSHTGLLHAEAREVHLADLNVSDLERKSLRDCDHVISPMAAVAENTRAMFGFSEAEWTPRLVTHLPPVRFESLTHRESASASSSDRPIVFASSLSRFQRPDLFARGVTGFMSINPDFLGQVVFTGKRTDKTDALSVARLFSSAWASRVRELYLEHGHWEELIAESTVVFTNAYPLYSSVAFKASLLGARVILNALNPIFAQGETWIDGVNCLKFDGTVKGLAETLTRNFRCNEKLIPVQYPEQPWPWNAVKPRSRVWHAVASPPLVSVVVPHYNLGTYLDETVRNIFAQTYKNIEILIVDDASTDENSLGILGGLVLELGPKLKLISLEMNIGLAAARNVGVRNANGAYVLTLDADDLIHSSFLSIGVTALENNPDFDIVVTPAGYFQDGEMPTSLGEYTNFSDYLVFSGESIVAGLLENRFSTATAIFRKSALDRFPYDESLNCYEDWSLYMRMCDAGLRFIVTTNIFFFYRRRHNSMVHRERDSVRMQVEYRDMLRTSVNSDFRQKSRSLLLGLASPIFGIAASDGYDVLQRKLANGSFGQRGLYDDQVAFASLKISRWLETNAPWVIRGWLGAARWAWRTYRVVRGRRSK